VKTDPASRTLTQLDRDHFTLIRGDVPEYVTALKIQNEPEIQVHGSSGRIHTLLGHYLIDELRVWINPWSWASASASSATARSPRAEVSRPDRAWIARIRRAGAGPQLGGTAGSGPRPRRLSQNGDLAMRVPDAARRS